jgi:endoribonuclease Dicer
MAKQFCVYCNPLFYRKKNKLYGGIQVDGMTVLVHGTVVAGPVVATSLSVAKVLASERALTILSDATSEKTLSRLCICKQVIEVEVAPITGKEAAFDDLSDSSKDFEEVSAILTQVDLAEGMD